MHQVTSAVAEQCFAAHLGLPWVKHSQWNRKGSEPCQHYCYSIQYQLHAAPSAGSADTDLGNTGTRSHLVNDCR